MGPAKIAPMSLNSLLQCPSSQVFTKWACLVILLCCLIRIGHADTIPCYYPDGSVSIEGGACLTNGSTSMCCGSDDSCTTSGWCLGSSGYLYRGGCTDRSWTSNGCMSICRDQAGATENLYPCSGGYFTRTFCCSGVQTKSCCAVNFTLPAYFSGQAYKPGQFEALSISGTSTSSFATSSTPTGTSTVPSSSQSSSGKSNENSHSMSIQSTIGLAVGLPLGILAVGVLTFLFWRERERRGERRGKVEMRPPLAFPERYEAPERHLGTPYQTPEFRNELPAHG